MRTAYSLLIFSLDPMPHVRHLHPPWAQSHRNPSACKMRSAKIPSANAPRSIHSPSEALVSRASFAVSSRTFARFTGQFVSQRAILFSVLSMPDLAVRPGSPGYFRQTSLMASSACCLNAAPLPNHMLFSLISSASSRLLPSLAW